MVPAASRHPPASIVNAQACDYTWRYVR